MYARALVAFLITFGCARGGLAQTTTDPTTIEKANGIVVKQEDKSVVLSWPIDGGSFGRLELSKETGKPLIRSLEITHTKDAQGTPIVKNADPRMFMFVGSRDAPPRRPPAMSVFNTFFDTPASRPFSQHASRFDFKSVGLVFNGRQATVKVAKLSVGGFEGEWEISVFAGSPLVKLTAAVSTKEERSRVSAGDRSRWNRPWSGPR